MRLFPRKKGEASKERHVRCSFCGKSKDHVAQLIAGPGVYLCNACLDLCKEILAEPETGADPLPLIAPKEKLKSKHLRCSFCGKGRADFDRIITGPSVYICNECVDLCSKTLAANARNLTPTD